MTTQYGSTTARPLADLPSPRGLPLLGNLHQLDLKKLHSAIENWGAELGSSFTFAMGPKRVFVTSDPDLAQFALRERPESFRRLSAIESVIDEMGFNGVFSAEGEAWRPQRKLVVQALSSRGFPSFFPILRTITDRLRQRWQQIAEKGAVTDVAQDLVRFTVDVTSTLSFGQDVNTLEQEGDLIQKHLGVIFPMVNLRVNLPVRYWRYVRLPQDRKLEESIEAVRTFVGKLIENARLEVARDPAAPPRNLLQAMIAAANEPDSGITDNEVYANVVTLLLAGEDTTAHTLAWTLYCMAQRPELQAQLQTAARDALGDSKVASDYEGTERLALFEGAAFEALRFKPIIPLIFLETKREVLLGDTILPAGTPVFLSLRPAMSADEHFADARQFNPERWTTGRHESGQAHNGRAFMQFGAGPRVCPGRQLAALEIRMALSMLSRNFSVEFASDPADVREVFSFTMWPSSLPLRLHALA
jgi:cytochrome P450